MANEVQIALRLPQGLADRADALAEALANDLESQALGRITRAGVLRLAIEHGLDVIEAKRRTRRKKSG